MEPSMNKKVPFGVFALLIALPLCIFAKLTIHDDEYIHTNNIPPRYQWDANNGYCGEVSLISAGLYYGQYISQYDMRSLALKNAPQNDGQLLIGLNDQYAANQLHLNCIEWDTDAEQSTDDFLAWVKQNVVKGYPVAIGIYINEYLFYGKTDPDAGDAEYDHIVPVMGIASNQPLTDPHYYPDDLICFSDNGLWGSSTNPPYRFTYAFGPFEADRETANEKTSPVYSLSNDASNYGIAITGVMDLNGDTLPVRVDTNFNYEIPEIIDGSNTRPSPMPLQLTITVSDLQPEVLYHLYRYNTLDAVPDSEFNANVDAAYEHCDIQISSGSTYTMTEEIQSDEIAVYRAVSATAP
jgi:hypothetical protein